MKIFPATSTDKKRFVVCNTVRTSLSSGGDRNVQGGSETSWCRNVQRCETSRPGGKRPGSDASKVVAKRPGGELARVAN